MGRIRPNRASLLLTLPLLAMCAVAGPGQTHPGTRRVDPNQPTVHDKNWLKAELKRRYGTTWIPDKKAGAKKSTTVEKKTSAPAKE